MAAAHKTVFDQKVREGKGLERPRGWAEPALTAFRARYAGDAAKAVLLAEAVPDVAAFKKQKFYKTFPGGELGAAAAHARRRDYSLVWQTAHIAIP